jgi:hypothetical protein
MAEKAEQPGKPKADTVAREARRAKALKANLRRRKAAPAPLKDKD